jgi:hypothetical protein
MAKEKESQIKNRERHTRQAEDTTLERRLP